MDEKAGFFKQIISKSSPESSMRFAMIFTYIFSVVTVYSAWAYAYVFKAATDLGPNIIMLTGSILAIVTGGKVVQQYNEGQEKKKDGTPNVG